MQKMAPPPHATRIPTRFPRGATFNIVGPNHLAYVDVRLSNNIENGTSAARGSYPHDLPFAPAPLLPCSSAPLPLRPAAGQRSSAGSVYWLEGPGPSFSWSICESRFRHSP